MQLRGLKPNTIVIHVDTDQGVKVDIKAGREAFMYMLSAVFVALDALQGCLYNNDNQVKRILLEFGNTGMNNFKIDDKVMVTFDDIGFVEKLEPYIA